MLFLFTIGGNLYLSQKSNNSLLVYMLKLFSKPPLLSVLIKYYLILMQSEDNTDKDLFCVMRELKWFKGICSTSANCKEYVDNYYCRGLMPMTVDDMY